MKKKHESNSPPPLFLFCVKALVAVLLCVTACAHAKSLRVYFEYPLNPSADFVGVTAHAGPSYSVCMYGTSHGKHGSTPYMTMKYDSAFLSPCSFQTSKQRIYLTRKYRNGSEDSAVIRWQLAPMKSPKIVVVNDPERIVHSYTLQSDCSVICSDLTPNPYDIIVFINTRK